MAVLSNNAGIESVRPRGKRLVWLLAWGYVAGVALVAVGLLTLGDRWWPATLMLYGPRWIWALPAPLLALAAIFERRLWALTAVAVALIVGIVLPYHLTWGGLWGAEYEPGVLRVLTCNVQSGRVDSAALHALIAEMQPDVVAMQEWSNTLTTSIFTDDHWFIKQDYGQCFASRIPIRASEVGVRLGEGYVRTITVGYDLETPHGLVRFINVHLATPRDGIEAMLHNKRAGIPTLEAGSELRRQHSEAVEHWAASWDGPLVIAGDFNMPVESRIYQTYWSQWSNALGRAGWGLGHTKFVRWFGARIDHVLYDRSWRCRSCWVGPDVGSDHRPVLADLEWVAR